VGLDIATNSDIHVLKKLKVIGNPGNVHYISYTLMHHVFASTLHNLRQVGPYKNRMLKRTTPHMWPNLLSSRLILKPTHGSWWKVGDPHRLDSALVKWCRVFLVQDDPKLPGENGEGTYFRMGWSAVQFTL
jgi:hypothetical protein